MEKQVDESPEMIEKDEDFADVYDDMLVMVKSEPVPETVLLVLTPPMIRMLAVWHKIPRRVSKEPDYQSALDVVWHHTNLDVAYWGRLAGVTDGDVWEYYRRMAALNIVYPDGSMPLIVKEHVRRQARLLMGQEES